MSFLAEYPLRYGGSARATDGNGDSISKPTITRFLAAFSCYKGKGHNPDPRPLA
jgi:hypothetical protein